MSHLSFIAMMLLAAPGASDALSGEAARGRAVMEAAQCNRCHAVSDVSGAGRGIAAAEEASGCVSCHVWILSTKGDPEAIAAQRETFPDWDRYLDSIVHFRRLPDLGTLTRRVDPAFVRAFLDAPFDLRPHLDETMIPVRLSAADKDAVVAYLSALSGDAGVRHGAAKGEEVSAARVAAGRARFVASGCATCHRVGGEVLVPGFDAKFYRAMGDQALLAPDLAYVGRRVPRDTLVRFIVDPRSVDPRSTMPVMGLDRAAADEIADFVLHGVRGVTPEVSAVRSVDDVPLLARKVTYDEVRDEVLGQICVHCHMAPESNAGDGGAGNTGGLGFVGLGLDLESYAGIRRGVLRGGKRVSVVEPPAPGESPLLLAALLRRHREVGTKLDGKQPGMPLGLPPLPVEQLSLVRTWLAQGAPGPIR